MKMIFRQTSTRILLSLLLGMTLLFAYGELLYPHSAYLPSGASLEAPSIHHILGTDHLGIDIFAQISRGYFSSMFMGILSAVLSFVAGGILGTLAGYKGGITDHIISFFINVFLCIPQLPVLIVLGAFFGQSIWNIIFIISLFSWAPIAKQIRAKTMSIKSRNYILLADAYGGKPFYIIKTHILLELLPLLIVNALGVIGKTIRQEASLAYLGLSDPLAKSWGLMINKASGFSGIYFTPYWKWWLLPPVIVLMTTILLTRLLARTFENEKREDS